MKTIQALDLVTLHVVAFTFFLFVLCGIILAYVPHQKKLKNQLVLSKCISYESTIYENSKNIYESLKNTTFSTISVLTCKCY
jgi:hypothetical protein